LHIFNFFAKASQTTSCTRSVVERIAFRRKKREKGGERERKGGRGSKSKM
jgi:hypothetical protein